MNIYTCNYNRESYAVVLVPGALYIVWFDVFHSFLYQGIHSLTCQHKQVLVGDNLIGQGFHNDIIAFWGHYFIPTSPYCCSVIFKIFSFE